jgi:REP element-mobilizing transposase RayT
LAFVAKYRCRVFDAAAIDFLRAIFADVCSDAYATLVERDGQDNHVHLLLEYPPKAAVSSLVNNLKGVSSRLLGVRVRRRCEVFRHQHGTTHAHNSFGALGDISIGCAFMHKLIAADRLNSTERVETDLRS